MSQLPSSRPCCRGARTAKATPKSLQAGPLLTVLMPAWNEQENLAANVPLLMAKLDDLAVDYELLIVDDGSTDQTPRLADELAARNPRARVVHHGRNQGIGRALYTGFQHACGRLTLFIPADLALELDEIEKYLNVAGETRVVVGLRSDRRGTSAARRLVSWANIALVRTLFCMPVHQFQYICLWPTRLLSGISIDYPDSAFLQAEVLIKARDLGYDFAEVDIQYMPRARGRASGARTRLVLRSARDMLHFWVRWLFRRRSSEGRRDWRRSVSCDERVEAEVVRGEAQL